MFAGLLQRIISYGINDQKEEFLANRIRRINLYHLILVILLSISFLWLLITGATRPALLTGAFLLVAAAIFFVVPPSRYADLNSMLILGLTGVLFLTGYLFDVGISGPLTMSLYLLFPLAAVSINGRHGILVPVFLGILTLPVNFLPVFGRAIHLNAYNTVVFFSLYTLMILISIFVERSNRKLVAGLKESRNLYETQVYQKDDFISKLSHRLRTSLSNITLINHLVHDSRLSSEQKELMETLRASTNNLIEDVNNIVEIASPGIIDFKKSIISFDLDRVLDEAVRILRSDQTFKEKVTVERTDSIRHFLIGDPSLLRNLVVNLIKGLSIYKNSRAPLMVVIENLRETPSQVRLEFSFSVESDLGEDLVIYMNTLKRGNAPASSHLATAYNLLLESESGISAIDTVHHATLSFFLDFTKDPTRVVMEPDAGKEAVAEVRKPLALKEARILLVEDNEINQKIVLLSLSSKVKQIEVAANGEIALQMHDQNQYDLILMDIQMPVMDGLTATKKIREIESKGDTHVPIIAITAYALTGDRDSCLAAGADDYLSKPFQAEELIKKMKDLLGR
ncbi:MAG TPA: response regulator [Bacteroides sp.]|nr:response regulator [Bacteroides sp.]